MQSKCKLTESIYMPFFHQDSLTFSNYGVCKSLWKQKTNSRQNKHKGLPTPRKTKLNYLKPAIRNTNHQRWILDKQYALWILISASSWVQKAWRSLKQRHRLILRNVHGNKKKKPFKIENSKSLLFDFSERNLCGKTQIASASRKFMRSYVLIRA